MASDSLPSSRALFADIGPLLDPWRDLAPFSLGDDPAPIMRGPAARGKEKPAGGAGRVFLDRRFVYSGGSSPGSRPPMTCDRTGHASRSVRARWGRPRAGIG